MLRRVAVGLLCVLFVSAAEVQGQARITASTMDSNGSVYVTGWRTVVANVRYEMATTKYDRDGVRQWTHAYPGDAARPDGESWGIAADPAGNVYVAAHVTGTRGVDCLLIKYPSDYTQGAEPEWVRTWDGGLGNDQNWTIALDLDGFIYVTGYSMQSHGGAPSADIVTMKYDSQGNLVWNRLYSGTGDGNENGYAIVVDPVTKNVYVVGTSLGAGPAETSRDMITISYDSAGTERWVQRYAGPVIGFNRGTSLALDAEGSVYVTGWSQGTGSIDYATIKYDASGQEIWVARYDGPGGGNDQPAPPVGGAQGSATSSYIQNNQGIIVTTEVLDPLRELPYLMDKVSALGLSRGLESSLLAKLKGCLASLRAKGADGRWNSHRLLGVFIDHLLDLAARHVLCVFIDQLERLAAAGLLTQDAADELVPVANQVVKSILGIETTVVYVTGQSTNAAGDVDFATIKYNAADGRPMWNLPGQPGTTAEKPGNPANIALRYAGAGNGVDRAWAMALNLDGDLFVAGPSTEASASSVDFFTIKYFVNTYQPLVLGQARYNGPGNKADQACGFATWMDPLSGRNYIYRDPETLDDYVAVTGNSIGTGTPAQEYTTIVYDTNLALRWLQRYHW